MTEPRSPLKDPPLRNPGQSLDEEMHTFFDDQATLPFMVVLGLWTVTLVEWFGYWRTAPRQPWIFTVFALAATIWLIWRLVKVRKKMRQLKLGRDGERVVGQFLDGLREAGARIFHDVPAVGFNLDHVVISTHGIYVVETKTITKPSSDAKVIYDGEHVTVAGFKPDRNPVTQAAAEASWLRQLLQQSTAREFPVRGVVAYPRWWIEQTNKDRQREVWVLEPKALPAWIEHAPLSMTPDEVAMAAFHLSRYVRGENDSKH